MGQPFMPTCVRCAHNPGGPQSEQQVPVQGGLGICGISLLLQQFLQMEFYIYLKLIQFTVR